MKNNKQIIWIVTALAVGLLAGWLLFGNGEKTPNKPSENTEVSNAEGGEIWTCSMHPQIRQPEPGECPICGMDLIPLEESSSNDPLVLEMTREAVKLSNIQTTTIGTKTGTNSTGIRLSGKIQPDERLASSQVVHVPGRIEKLYVSFTGEQVNKGQKIALVYSPELITAQRELLEAAKLESVNPQLLEAAKNKLKYWKISENVIEEIIQSGTIKETFPVFADESGTVTKRRVSVGDYVRQGEALFDLMNLYKVWALFDVYEDDFSKISVGNKITFTTPSLPGKTFTSNITFIDPVINPSTRVASIRTEVTNAGGKLKPEMLIYGNLENAKGDKGKNLTVPKTAVLWTGKRSVVYVKVPDMNVPSFSYREVELGESTGDAYQVLSGLEAGEEVVTNGAFSIDAAAQLNNQASMMNHNVEVKGEKKEETAPDFSSETPTAFKEQLAALTRSYLEVKDALVETDAQKAGQESGEVLKSLEAIDMELLEGPAHMFWMKELKSLKAHAGKLKEASDVEIQREQFDYLSQALIKTLKAFGVTNNTFYVQHCPMANENNGADWISAEKKILNPYFGDKMLTCGAVITVLDPDYKNPKAAQTTNSTNNTHNH
ncbi:MAG: efflux RND transporter periplasmic adaptor subunit [Saprospiraceae bacterium]|nr:efflux RND transporter periplasmic adaptor subunit [Saprospiraceae bacterium]